MSDRIFQDTIKRLHDQFNLIKLDALPTTDKILSILTNKTIHTHHYNQPTAGDNTRIKVQEFKQTGPECVKKSHRVLPQLIKCTF